MKKVVRTAAMIALMFVTATGMANDGKLSLETKKESKSLVFQLDSQSTETTIKLFDPNDHVIYFENISNGSYVRNLNLENLDDGLYYFTSEDSLKKVTYIISVEKFEVKILERKENHKPIFRKENKMVYLNLLNLEKKKVDIKVYDSSDRLVFSEKGLNEMIIEKAFNFSKAYNDTYTVVVRDGNDSYYESVIVK